MAITNAGISQLFSGQSDIVLFDKVTDYSTAKIETLLNPISLGQIVQDSTSWDGDDPDVTQIKDEQGDVITSKVTAGTLAFSFEMADTSAENLLKFLNPGSTKKITATTGAAWAAENGITKVTPIGDYTAVMTRPIMIINDEGDRSLVFPKAKIVANLSMSDGLYRIKVSATAENIDTADLSTGMFIEGKVDYAA
jgi:hypothetical protein